MKFVPIHQFMHHTTTILEVHVGNRHACTHIHTLYYCYIITNVKCTSNKGAKKCAKITHSVNCQGPVIVLYVYVPCALVATQGVRTGLPMEGSSVPRIGPWANGRSFAWDFNIDDLLLKDVDEFACNCSWEKHQLYTKALTAPFYV